VGGGPAQTDKVPPSPTPPPPTCPTRSAGALAAATMPPGGAAVASASSAGCEVDDVEWVRCFTRHGASRPVKASLISPRPPQPQGLPRHPQWRGRQGPHGTSQGSSRTSGGRPQPHTPATAPHTNLPWSSTPNGLPSERSAIKDMQGHHTNTKNYYLRKGQLSVGDCGSTHHTPPSTPGIIPVTRSNSHHGKSVQGPPGTI